MMLLLQLKNRVWGLGEKNLFPIHSLSPPHTRRTLLSNCLSTDREKRREMSAILSLRVSPDLHLDPTGEKMWSLAVV